MRGVWLIGVLALAGCDRVFDLEGRQPVDATDPPDDTCRDPSQTGNEDTDTLVDGCDNCPLITNQPQRDDDGDGVGNACDPNPDQAIEEIALFDPMNHYDESKWQEYGFSYDWATGAGGRDIQQTNRGDMQDNNALLIYKNLVVDQPMLQVKVIAAAPDVDVGTAPPDLSVVGVYLILDGSIGDATPDGMICGIEYPTTKFVPNNAWSRVQKANVASGAATASATGTAIAVVTLMTNENGKQPNQLVVPHCTVVRGDDPVAEPIGTSSLAPVGAQVGLFTNNASATFSALFVTKRRTAPL